MVNGHFEMLQREAPLVSRCSDFFQACGLVDPDEKKHLSVCLLHFNVSGFS